MDKSVKIKASAVKNGETNYEIQLYKLCVANVTTTTIGWGCFENKTKTAKEDATWVLYKLTL